jgi:hypothetical protein
MFQTKIVDNQNTLFMFNNSFWAVYEIMWINMVEADRAQITVYCGVNPLHVG